MSATITPITNHLISDYNKSGYTVDILSTKVFHDVATTFIHPQTGDVSRSTDLDAIRNSIKNIILTEKGTRPFDPEFGTRVPSLLFELNTWVTRLEIKDEIVRGLKKFEPRISKLEVEVKNDIEDIEPHSYYISILFVPSYGGLVTIEFKLKRIR